MLARNTATVTSESDSDTSGGITGLQKICLAGLEEISAHTGTPLISQTTSVKKRAGDAVGLAGVIIEARFIADTGQVFAVLLANEARVIARGEGLVLELLDYGNDLSMYSSVFIEIVRWCVDGKLPSQALVFARGRVNPE